MFYPLRILFQRHHDSTTKNWQAESITDAWQHFFGRIKDNGYTPDLHIIDNEFSDLLKVDYKNITLTFNVFPLTATDKTRLNVPSKPENAT